MMNTVINFLFKNFIALWRHLAKTQVLYDAQIYLYNVNKRQQLCFRQMAPQRDEIFKQNVNDCVQHIILQKFTNFHAIRSWNFRIFAMRWWPRFIAPPCIVSVAVCEIFSVKEWCDLENRVRVCSRSLKMAPFDRSHTSSYSPSMVTMAISCIVCEIQRLINQSIYFISSISIYIVL